MVDLVKIHVKAGDGGDGAVSFFHNKYQPKGPADGGDGGKGGDIILKTSLDARTLLDFHYKSEFKAASGKRGAENHKQGEQGEDLVLKVPLGTVVEGIGELIEPEQELIVARGGKGGNGNAHLRASTYKIKNPERRYQLLQQAQVGQTGEDKILVLELKLVADVGIIGLPNAGKSTLLSVLTSARPKIADYPFTTLEPNLGVIRVEPGKSLVVADIPGLIEGAASGKGLGLEFLRHVERTKILLHLISAENSDLRQAYQTVRKELNAYSIELSKKEELVVMSKLDILAPKERKLKIRELKQIAKNALTISAVTGEGIEELRTKLAKLLQE